MNEGRPAFAAGGAPHAGVRSFGSIWVDVIFALAIVSLFSTFEAETPIGKTRPFDYLSILCGGAMLLVLKDRGLLFSKHAVLHFAFLAVYLLSAFSQGLMNGLREGIQVGTVVVFVAALMGYVRQRPNHSIMLIAAIMLVGIILWNIWWHVSNGFYVGFKRLDEPKAGFIFLPAILAVIVARWSKPAAFALAMVALAMIFMSGERKAYMVGLLFVVTYIGLADLRLLLAGAVAAAGLLVLASVDETGYLARQKASILTPQTEIDFFSLDETENLPASFSNAQRKFAFEFGWTLVEENPIFGIGTNAYAPLVVERFPTLPEYLTIAIHGEFFRSLVENGIIGFLLYVGAWLAAARAVFSSVRLRRAFTGMRDLEHARFLIFAGCLAFSAFESAKTLSILAFLLPPLLPALLPDRPRVAAARAPEQVPVGVRRA
jgi:O-antigen ligase